VDEEEISLDDLFHRHTMPLDHQIALKTALYRLTRKFSSMFTEQTIEVFLTGSYEQYAGLSRVPHFVHILAERFAFERLTAFAVAEHHLTSGQPIVVFVCGTNDLLSPMARGLFMKHAGDGALAWSAGLEPALTIRPGARAALKEIGVDISKDFPKPLALEMLQAATTVVGFGCLDEIPRLPGREYLAADAPVAAAGDEQAMRRIRDWLNLRTAELLGRLS
jgi:arsenate reductase